MTDTTPTDETPAEEPAADESTELQNVAGEADPNANPLEEDVPAVETPAPEVEEVPPSQEDQEKEAEAISEANRAAADAAEGA